MTRIGVLHERFVTFISANKNKQDTCIKTISHIPPHVENMFIFSSKVFILQKTYVLSVLVIDIKNRACEFQDDEVNGRLSNLLW